MKIGPPLVNDELNNQCKGPFAQKMTETQDRSSFKRFESIITHKTKVWGVFVKFLLTCGALANCKPTEEECG